jgi:UDP-hydrolysing UDP-N-acetyl-D-glucosamine 2-epimerase
MQAIAAEPALTLQLVVCGQHLDPRFGETWEAIEADGFKIDARVDLGLTDDSRLAVTVATGRAVGGLAEVLTHLKPDLVLVLGDRYEILAAGVAALLLNIPLAHIHGGELTEAAMDDSIRHALSKMASLHFVAAAPYAQRVIQMGEEPARVIVSGAPGLDQIATLKPLTRAELAAQLKLTLADPLFLITYHPVTLQRDDGGHGVTALLQALNAYPTATMVFTGVNSDPGHRAIQDMIAAFVAGDPSRRVAVASLGQRGYLSAMGLAAAVVGNSSSGLIEAPTLGIPSVNIGDRQKGRLRSPTVIDSGEDTAAIREALARALDPGFRAHATGEPAYGRGGAAAKIVAALKAVPLSQLSVKHFHDILPR